MGGVGWRSKKKGPEPVGREKPTDNQLSGQESRGPPGSASGKKIAKTFEFFFWSRNGDETSPQPVCRLKKAGDHRRAKLEKKLQRPLNFFSEPERRERPAGNTLKEEEEEPRTRHARGLPPRSRRPTAMTAAAASVCARGAAARPPRPPRPPRWVPWEPPHDRRGRWAVGGLKGGQQKLGFFNAPRRRKQKPASGKNAKKPEATACTVTSKSHGRESYESKKYI